MNKPRPFELVIEFWCFLQLRRLTGGVCARTLALLAFLCRDITDFGVIFSLTVQIPRQTSRRRERETYVEILYRFTLMQIEKTVKGTICFRIKFYETFILHTAYEL